MADVLLSIKPKYMDLILAGTKRYELRRGAPKLREGDRLVLYSTSPQKEVVGVCLVGEVVTAAPTTLYREVNGASGLSRATFLGYLAGRSVGTAIELRKVRRLNQPVSLATLRASFGRFVVPQSYRFMSQDEVAICVAAGPRA